MILWFTSTLKQTLFLHIKFKNSDFHLKVNFFTAFQGTGAGRLLTYVSCLHCTAAVGKQKKTFYYYYCYLLILAEDA